MAKPTTPGELAKHRGFYIPSMEAYGGSAGFYTYGPLGARLKRNIESLWREVFVIREGHYEIEGPTVMTKPVFEASGHVDDFDDMLVTCPECETSHRADHIVEDAAGPDVTDAESLATDRIEAIIADHEITCPDCGTSLAGQTVTGFNLMFHTNIGPGSAEPGILRPETAQAIFVEFPRLKQYARTQLPFGVAQVGRAYRNEISPRRALSRLREFTQAELEHFIDEDRDRPDLTSVADVELPLYSARAQLEDGEVRTMPVSEAVGTGLVDPWIAYYLAIAKTWYERIGVDMDRFRYRQHLADERAHYASDCWDAEAEVDGSWLEITGFAYRGSHDLENHHNHSNDSYTMFREYDEPKVVNEPVIDPDMSVLGPRFEDDTDAVVEALERKLEREPAAFEGETVAVTVDGETHELSVDATGYHVEERTEQGEHRFPAVVEPSFGVDRLVYTVFAHSIRVDQAAVEADREDRTVLELPSEVAPTSAAVFPLSDDEPLVDTAQDLVAEIRSAGLQADYDESGAIGRRYYRQDEAGTPFCVTVDSDGLADTPQTVTLRDRDTAGQVRLPAETLVEELQALCANERSFNDLLDEYTVETEPRTTTSTTD